MEGNKISSLKCFHMEEVVNYIDKRWRYSVNNTSFSRIDKKKVLLRAKKASSVIEHSRFFHICSSERVKSLKAACNEIISIDV